MNGSPPTERKARTGLFTPPTNTCSARLKISRERAPSRFDSICDCAGFIAAPAGCSRAKPPGRILGVISHNDLRSSALTACEYFRDYALLVQPAFLYGGLHHGVFPADVIGRDGHIEFIAYAPDDIQVRQSRLD